MSNKHLKVNKVYQLYLELLKEYGPAEKFWPQWCAKEKTLKDRELIALGAILTQRTSWHNAHLALVNLKKAGLLSLEKIVQLSDLKKLAALIKPAGFFQTKACRLFDFSSFICQNYKDLKNFTGEELKIARQKLLTISGIGPETADTILLYALDKPTFVVDEYAKRMVRERGLFKYLNYDRLKEFFEKSLPKDAKVYQDFHALIIISQKGKEKSMMERID